VEGPARTARTVRARARISCVEACSCRRCRARPVPCTHLDICMHYAATGRLEHARMTLHAYESAGELKTRAQPDSHAVTVCTCPHREHAACIRRSLRAGACADDSAGVRMRTRLIAHAQRAFARSLWALVSRVVCNMCAMDNMVLKLSCSCRAILSAYELSAPAAGATACMRVRVWPHGARGFARIPLNVLRVAVPACGDVLASALRLRHRCVATAV